LAYIVRYGHTLHFTIRHARWRGGGSLAIAA
jgi:hypothetical protein